MTRDFIVGAIFILALIFLGVLTVVVKGIPSGSSDLVIEVGFEDVGGLRPGEPVRIRGLRAGTVERISLDQARDQAIAHLRLWENLPPREGYSFEVTSASALGGTFLKYIPGSGPLVKGPLEGDASGNLLGEVGSMLAENRAAIKSSLDNLDKLLTNLASGEGVVGGLLNNNDARDMVADIITETKSILTDIKNGDGVLGSLLLEGTEQQQQFNRVMALLQENFVYFSEGNGTLGMLFKDKVVQGKVDDSITRISTITETLTGTDGLAGKILNDPSLSQYWTEVSRNLKNASIQLSEDGQGAMRDILFDGELREKLGSAVAAIASISVAIEQGPGTLHSLIHNPELYLEARETLTLLRDSTEDLREQEPVTAFFSILFAPF